MVVCLSKKSLAKVKKGVKEISKKQKFSTIKGLLRILGYKRKD